MRDSAFAREERDALREAARVRQRVQDRDLHEVEPLVKRVFDHLRHLHRRVRPERARDRTRDARVRPKIARRGECQHRPQHAQHQVERGVRRLSTPVHRETRVSSF